VQDRNNQPLAGVLVQFSIRGGSGATGTPSASFAGGQAVSTVTTDAAGRASAPALQVTGVGQLVIDVRASYQGQVATATVNQSNVATAADAASAGARAAGQAVAPGPRTAGGGDCEYFRPGCHPGCRSGHAPGRSSLGRQAASPGRDPFHHLQAAGQPCSSLIRPAPSLPR
jgi:hypothetical protein